MSYLEYWKNFKRVQDFARVGEREKAQECASRLLTTALVSDQKIKVKRLNLIKRLCETYGLTVLREPDFCQVDIDLDSYVGFVSPGVSLVTCCMNRNENLIRAISSWIECKELSEIIIVDWSSDEPVYSYIELHGIMDERIRVVRIDDEARWILSYAFNIGFRAARYDKILKTDADIILEKNFFQKNILSPGFFISGDWRVAAKGQEHINGFFYISREDLMKVNGFNEYITTYGWDDDDIYNRLQAAGARRTTVDLSTIYHIPHNDGQRLGESLITPGNAVEEFANNTLFKIRVNHYIAHVMPDWNKDRTSLPCKVIGEGARYVKIRRSGEALHRVPSHIRDDAEYYAAMEMLSWRIGVRVFEIERSRLRGLMEKKKIDSISTIDIEFALSEKFRHMRYVGIFFVVKILTKLIREMAPDLEQFLRWLSREVGQFGIVLVIAAEDENSIARVMPPNVSWLFVPLWRDLGPLRVVQAAEIAAELSRGLTENVSLELDRTAMRAVGQESRSMRLDVNASARPAKLYVDAQHGLGNRLRAIASAAAIAESANRELVVIWEPDCHCECRFSDLFDYSGEVIERSFIAEARERGMLVFNYMEVEDGAKKDVDVVLVDGADAYARSAYTLKSTLTDWDKENVFLRSLKPSRAVLDLVNSVDVEGRIGVHVRMEGGRGLDQNSYDSNQNWTDEGHEQLHYWREKSHYSRFVKRIDQLIKESPELRLFLATDLPENYRIFEDYYGERLAHLKRDIFDRSEQQIVYGLADAILLSRCRGLLGSTWSSFSELAMRLSTSFSALEMSGKDF